MQLLNYGVFMYVYMLYVLAVTSLFHSINYCLVDNPLLLSLITGSVKE